MSVLNSSIETVLLAPTLRRPTMGIIVRLQSDPSSNHGASGACETAGITQNYTSFTWPVAWSHGNRRVCVYTAHTLHTRPHITCLHTFKCIGENWFCARAWNVLWLSLKRCMIRRLWQPLPSLACWVLSDLLEKFFKSVLCQDNRVK